MWSLKMQTCGRSFRWSLLGSAGRDFFYMEGSSEVRPKYKPQMKHSAVFTRGTQLFSFKLLINLSDRLYDHLRSIDHLQKYFNVISSHEKQVRSLLSPSPTWEQQVLGTGLCLSCRICTLPVALDGPGTCGSSQSSYF